MVLLLKSVVLLVFTGESVITSCFASRHRPACTHTIHRDAHNHSDQVLFGRIEKFLQNHTTARVLAWFLNKGYLVVGMRFRIGIDRGRPKFLPDYLFLKTTTGLGERYFSDESLSLSGLDEARFLSAVKYAFRQTYYKRNDVRIPLQGRFVTMLQDNVIRTYFRNIAIDPILMYVESNITVNGLRLHLVEVSARDTDECFFAKGVTPLKRKNVCPDDETPPRRRSMNIVEVRADRLYGKSQSMIERKLSDYANTTMWSTVENSFDISSRGVEYHLIKPLISIVFDYVKEMAVRMARHVVKSKCEDTLDHLKHKSETDVDLLLGDVTFLLRPVKDDEYDVIAKKFSEITMSLLRQFVERTASLLAEIVWSHVTNTDQSTQRKLMDVDTCLKNKSGNAAARNATENMAVLYSLILNSSNCTM